MKVLQIFGHECFLIVDVNKKRTKEITGSSLYFLKLAQKSGDVYIISVNEKRVGINCKMFESFMEKYKEEIEASVNGYNGCELLRRLSRYHSKKEFIL